jgi:hypothetical protein
LIVVLYPQNNDGSLGNLLADQSIRATFTAGCTDLPDPTVVRVSSSSIN